MGPFFTYSLLALFASVAGAACTRPDAVARAAVLRPVLPEEFGAALSAAVADVDDCLALSGELTFFAPSRVDGDVGAYIAPALVSEFSGEVDTLDGSAVLWTEEAFRFEDEEGDENESSSSHTPDVPNPDTDATDATDATDDNNYTDTNSATEAFVAIDGHVWAVTDVLSGDGYIVYLLGHSEERREIDPALLSETHMLKGGGRGGSGGRSSSKSSGSSSSSKGSVGSSSSGSSGSSGSTGGKTVVKGVTSNTGSNSMRPLIIITGNGRSCRSYDNRTCSAADRLSVMWALPVAMLASLVL